MRQQIQDEFTLITPFDARERSDLTTCLAWVASGAPLCRTAKPATPAMHLVSYFAVIDAGHILLVDHRNAQLWLPPGGHVDPGEHPRITVQRECKEELGFTPDHAIGPPAFVTITTTVGLTAGHTDVSLWYVVHASRYRPITFDEREFASIRWFACDDVPPDRADPHLRRFLAKLALKD